MKAISIRKFIYLSHFMDFRNPYSSNLIVTKVSEIPYVITIRMSIRLFVCLFFLLTIKIPFFSQRYFSLISVLG